MANLIIMKLNQFSKYLILQLYKIYNLFTLWLFCKNKYLDIHKFIKKNQLSDRETLLCLKRNPGLGIIRNGNSELGLIVGNSPQTQSYDKNLRDKLVKNCWNYNNITIKKYLLALPLETLEVGHGKRNLPGWYPGQASRLAMKFLIKKKQKYASPFCFRIGNVEDDDMEEYLNIIKSLFIGRKIIYVGPMKDKNTEIPEFIKPSEIIKIPAKNAFEKFDEIISQIRLLSKNYKNPLVVVVGGTTAAALSYELNMTNITCYDFGQFNRFYKQSIKNKVSANEK